MSPRYSIVTSSIRGHGYTISITQSQIHLFNQHKVLQRVPQSFYRRVKTKTCDNPYAYVHGRNPQVGHQNIHQVAHDIPLSPQISTTRRTSSVLKSLNTLSGKKTSKGKLNSSQESRSNYNSKSQDTSRSCHRGNTRENTRERERERSNT